MSHFFYEQKYPELKLEKEGAILWIYLDRPQAKNALTDEMIQGLVEVLGKADRDSDIRVMVLGGTGGAFCAGGDVKLMERREGMFAGDSNELRERYSRGIQQIPLAFHQLQTPILAMVEGVAIGAGCDLAAMCDFRVAGAQAKFAETFSKISLVPGDGGTYFLPQVVGYAKAMEMFLTGKVYGAQEALEMGLVNYVYSEKEVKAKVRELAFMIAQNAPVAIQMTKRALMGARHMELRTHLDLLAAFQGISQRTQDHQEGLRALQEKRAPEFKGQ